MPKSKPLAVSTICALASPVLGLDPEVEVDGTETRFVCERRTAHTGAHRVTLQWSPDPQLIAWEGTE